MNNYYYMDPMGQQKGPIKVEDFQQYGVQGHTLIWCKGMRDWRPACEIIEASYFERSPQPPTPPPYINQQPTPQPPHPNPYPNPGPVYPNQDYSGMTKPDNYMVWSILCTLFCGWLPGIVAIVYASKVDKQWNAGDYIGARNSSEKAKIWCFVALGLGILVGIIAFIGAIAGA